MTDQLGSKPGQPGRARVPLVPNRIGKICGFQPLGFALVLHLRDAEPTSAAEAEVARRRELARLKVVPFPVGQIPNSSACLELASRFLDYADRFTIRSAPNDRSNEGAPSLSRLFLARQGGDFDFIGPVREVKIPTLPHRTR